MISDAFHRNDQSKALELEENRHWKLQLFVDALQSLKAASLDVSEETKVKYEKRIAELSYQNYIKLDNNDTYLLGKYLFLQNNDITSIVCNTFIRNRKCSTKTKFFIH